MAVKFPMTWMVTLRLQRHNLPSLRDAQKQVNNLVFVGMVFSLLPVLTESVHVSNNYFRSRCGLDLVPNQVADVVHELVTMTRCSSLCARDVCCTSLAHTLHGNTNRGNCHVFYSFPAVCSGLHSQTSARYLIRETDEHPCISFPGSCAICGYNNPATTEPATTSKTTTEALETTTTEEVVTTTPPTTTEEVVTTTPPTTTEEVVTTTLSTTTEDTETTVVTTTEAPTDEPCWALNGYCLERSFYDCSISGTVNTTPGLCGNPSYECCMHSSDRFCRLKGGVCQREGVDPCVASIYLTNHCAGPGGRKCCLSQTDTDIDCWQLGGFCDDPGFYGCGGGTVHTGAGLCSTPGEQCCATSSDDTCRTGRGVCQSDTQACTGTYATSMCAGPGGRKCCKP